VKHRNLLGERKETTRGLLILVSSDSIPPLRLLRFVLLWLPLGPVSWWITARFVNETFRRDLASEG